MVVTDPRYDLPRDLEDYGEHSLNPQWPHGAKICVSFLLNYKGGGERTVLNGDAHSEPYLWEKGASSNLITGARHISAESEYEYGSRSGAWRILRLFKEMGWHFKSWAIAQAMEKNPSFAKACVRDGHKIAAHGLRWLDIGEMTVEEESEYIKECALSLERTTGVFPKGYFYCRASPIIRALCPEVMRKMGKKLLYSNGKFYMSPGFTGSSWLDYLKGTFDMLYREGCNGSPKLMNFPMHSRIMGKLGRSQDLRKFMLYVKEKGVADVWVATREEIAEHFRSKSPYTPGHLAPGHLNGREK